MSILLLRSLVACTFPPKTFLFMSMLMGMQVSCTKEIRMLM
jgi:hypothetical protein